MDKLVLAEKHNIVQESIFKSKSFLHIVSRFANNIVSSGKKPSRNNLLYNAPVIASSESELWNKYDNELNWILTAGKIENLRIASKRIHNIEVPANSIFSFWELVGYPGTRQGYVEGREIREGCLVATIGGGLCQLSNALYDAALKAGFEIIERHKHTKVIQGSLAEKDRDATVKWNYVNLRFKSKYLFRIEVKITEDTLGVYFKSEFKVENIGVQNKQFISSKLNDCFSCGNLSCSKHPNKTTFAKKGIVSTYILDEKWDEYNTYLAQNASAEDYFLISHVDEKKRNYNWTVTNKKRLSTTPFMVYRRSLSTRLNKGSNGKLPPLLLEHDRKIAKALAKKIPVESTHLIISQNLLPYLWEEGSLGGRTYDVLMTRLPMEILHNRLDEAYSKFPESKTLGDFRAPQSLIDLENAALTRSRKIITPHKEIADIFNNKSILLDWKATTPKPTAVTKGNKVLFPASTLARKGAYEVKKLAQELCLDIVVTGNTIEQDNFWSGINFAKAGHNPFEGIKLIIYPAYIEHQPRFLLRALSMGIPVIATSACGLTPQPNLTIVPTGDYDALKKAVSNIL